MNLLLAGRGLVFVVTMAVGSLCCLVIGGIELYGYLEFHLNVERSQARMRYDDPTPIRTLESRDGALYSHFLEFETAAGSTVHVSPFVNADQRGKLLAGESIEILYLSHDPHRVAFDYERNSTGWHWIITGIVLLAVTVVARRLLLRETGHG